MIDIRYERHMMENSALPFIFHNISMPDLRSGITNWHDNTEFIHCTDGYGFVNCDSNSIEMKKGDTVVINARCLHSIRSICNFKYHCLIVDNSFFKDNGIEIEKINFDETVDDKSASEKMTNIAACIKNKELDLYVARTRLAILDYICHMTENFSHRVLDKSNKTSKGYAAVLDAIEYINNHFSEKLTLEEIASKVGFSRYHFTRIFKENTGVTVVEHINARRCDNASFLLRKTNKPISEIGVECGFDSPSYFAKSFSSSYGLLPSEYRKKYSNV